MQGFPFDSQLTFDDDNLPVYDRAISSQPLRKLIRDLFTTGVMPNPSTNLQVSSGTDGMTVQVQAGFAVVDGGLCQETETRTLTVTAADTTYDRIDTVVLRWNENVDARKADLYVVAGTPSATPVRPTLQRDNSIYEIGLADVFITKRVATITDDKITDTRYEAERCGIVSSVSEWDTTTIYQQVQADLAGFKSTEQAEFTTWFDYMKDQLSEDAAGHLQLEIDDLKKGTGVFYTTDAEAEADIENIEEGAIVYTNDGEDEPINARQVAFDDGSTAGSNVETQITQLNSDLDNKQNKLSTIQAQPVVSDKSSAVIGAIINERAFGKVVELFFDITTNATISANSLVISLAGAVSLPNSGNILRFGSATGLNTSKDFYMASSGVITAIESLPADRYLGSVTYIID